MYGPYALLAQNPPKVVEWLAEKMKVDPNLIQNESQIIAGYNAMEARFMQQQQAQQQAQGQPIQGTQPTVPLLPQPQ
jgi:hypothetical protein